jgi:patatin-like phospholipase/acyl hydrolase
MVAGSLAYGFTPKQIYDLYINYGKDILSSNLAHKLKTVGGLTGPQLNRENLEEMLHLMVGNTKLTALKRKVLIPAFDLMNEKAKAKAEQHWRPKIFDITDNIEIATAILATTAAPSYFSSYKVIFWKKEKQNKDSKGVSPNTPRDILMVVLF